MRQGGRRRSHAADVLRNRINNEMPAPDASVPGQLLGREGAQERQTLQKIRRIQKIAVAWLKMSGMWNQPCSKSNLPSWLFRPETNRCRCLIRPPGACRFRTCFHGVMACLFRSVKPTWMQQKCFDICCFGKNCITVRVMLCCQDGRFQRFGFGLCNCC